MTDGCCLTYSIEKGAVKMEKLIREGNAIYELDLECVREKQGKKKGKQSLEDMERSSANDFEKKTWKDNARKKQQSDFSK